VNLKSAAATERRTRVVAIAGAKGSPGCTFIAVGLARCLADSGIDTLLVDADAEDVGVAPALGLPGQAAPDLGRAAALGLDADALREATEEVAPRLRALHVSGEKHADGREMVGAARRDHALVVIDLGHAWGRLQRQLAAAADWVLWVVVADRQGLERADRGLAALLPGGGRGLVVNRAARWSLAGGDRVLVERHRIPLVARVPDNRRSARRVTEQSVPAHRERAFRRALQQIARTVHPDVQGGGTWP